MGCFSQANAVVRAWTACSGKKFTGDVLLLVDSSGMRRYVEDGRLWLNNGLKLYTVWFEVGEKSFRASTSLRR